MIQLIAFLNTDKIKMTFQKATTDDGEHYYGSLFTQPVTDFSFIVGNDANKTVRPFLPVNLEMKIQATILKAINKYEEDAKSLSF